MQPALASGIDKSRYQLLTKIAAGGMGTVYVGRLRGAAGFRRLVAIKRAHPHLVDHGSFAKVLLEEARLASLIRHPNAVSVVDVEELEGELLLVMEYVDGVSLSALIQALDPDEGDRLPAKIAVRIVLDVAAGLHACHTATDEEGKPLDLVHRDVSPQNVLVGADGQSRLTDFGIAKSLVNDDKLTQTGTMKGKSGYMAPEYAAAGEVDARSDVFGLGVVLWEALTGQRLFRGATELETLKLLTETDAAPVSEAAPWIGDGLDEVVAVALDRDPARRFETAEAFAHALEQAARPLELVARHRDVGELVRELFGTKLDARRQAVRVGATLDPGAVTADMVPGPETADLEAEPDDAALAAPEPSTLEASTLEHTRTTEATRRRPWLWAALALGLLGGVGTAIGLGMRAESAAPAASVPPTPTATMPTADPTARAAPAAPAEPSATAAATPSVAISSDPDSDTTAAPAPPRPRFPTAATQPTPAPTPRTAPKSEMSAAPNPFKNTQPSPKSPYDR